jgi:hypothetical protein
VTASQHKPVVVTASVTEAARPATRCIASAITDGTALRAPNAQISTILMLILAFAYHVIAITQRLLVTRQMENARAAQISQATSASSNARAAAMAGNAVHLLACPLLPLPLLPTLMLPRICSLAGGSQRQV